MTLRVDEVSYPRMFTALRLEGPLGNGLGRKIVVGDPNSMSAEGAAYIEQIFMGAAPSALSSCAILTPAARGRPTIDFEHKWSLKTKSLQTSF
jgi:hypothetical protein